MRSRVHRKPQLGRRGAGVDRVAAADETRYLFNTGFCRKMSTNGEDRQLPPAVSSALLNFDCSPLLAGGNQIVSRFCCRPTKKGAKSRGIARLLL
jgi:hypothetical protein